MKYRALRGICIGVERHLAAGETADLDPATGKFLISIAAVEEVKEPPSPPAGEPKSEPISTPEKSGRKEK